MNATIDKEAGLYTQIRTLKKRIDSLDMSKVNPAELKAAIDSLKDLETRYADMQEKKKQRSIEKQNREKELASQTVVSEEVKPESVPVEAAPGGMLTSIPLPMDEQPVAPPVAQTAPVDAPVVTAESEPMAPEKKAEEPKPEEKLETMDLTKDPEFDSMIAQSLYMKMLDYLIMADDPQHDVISKFRKAIERVQNEEDREKLKAVFNKEFAVNKETPWDYYSQAKKETEITPDQKSEVIPEKQAAVGKFALDDIVEPVYGTAGSYGRVMRYDADKDMAYVHWDSGKLADDHGFGAYKGSDLRKRASSNAHYHMCRKCDVKLGKECGCGHPKVNTDVCSNCKEASVKIEARVVHQKDGWHVLSEEGKNLGGPYDSKEKAVERLRQVEYFKHHKKAEGDGMGYGGDRPGIAVAPKRDEDVSLNAEPNAGGVMELNIANRKWTAKRTSGNVGIPDAWVIFDDQGQQVMAITMKDRELSQPEIEQIVFDELGKRDLVRATLKTNLSVLKKGHKVKIVSVDVNRKEVKFASLEMKSVTGWSTFDRFDFEIVADRKPKLDSKCKECGATVPMTYSEEVICRDCKRKKEKKDHEASLMPLSKTDKIVRIKSVKVLTDLAKDCPDCYKKFLKFAQEKGLHIQADDLSDHVDQMRTKMTQTKEVLQTQTQAGTEAPESVETEAALPPKPSVTLPQGMKWMFNIDTNTWDMVTDTQFTY